MLKNDFISNVSHEIKSPLAVIQSYTKALKDGHGTPEQKAQYMDIILAASQNMNSLRPLIYAITLSAEIVPR